MSISGDLEGSGVGLGRDGSREWGRGGLDRSHTPNFYSFKSVTVCFPAQNVLRLGGCEEGVASAVVGWNVPQVSLEKGD